MYSDRFSIRVVFLVVVFCASAAVCLKKDEFYCQMSSPCVCVSANNDRIDLNGVNVSLNVTTNVTLNYRPCPDDSLGPSMFAVSIRIEYTNT